MLLLTPASAAEEPAAVRIPDGVRVTFPVLQKKTAPTYPPLAIRTAQPGLVVVDAVVLTDGRVERKGLPVLHAAPRNMGFEQAAVAAVKRWRYEPGSMDGVPVDTRMAIVVDFAVEEEGQVVTRNAWPEFWLECRREAFAAREAGDGDEAEWRLRHAVYDAEHLGEADARLALSHKELADFLADSGEAERACQELAEAHRIYEAAEGAEHPNTVAAAEALAACSQEAGE